VVTGPVVTGTVARAATVDGVFRERLAAAPDAEFVRCGGGWITFAELDERSDRLATGLARLGVGRGDMVATILPNRIETVEILLAVAKLGAVQVPLNYYLKGEFLGYQLDDRGAGVLIADGPGFGYYVSVGRAYGMRQWVVPGDRMYTGFPMFHTSGQMVAFMAALVNGATISIAPDFHASTFMADAAADSATMLVGVGVMGNLILAQPPGPADGACRFRLAVWVPMPEEQQRRFEARFGTPVMSEGYGQTECVPITCSAPDGRRERGTSGLVSPLLEVQVVDENDATLPYGEAGEIVVRPKVPNAMYSGYWRQESATVDAWRSLWHHTGDHGRLDANGYLTFVDRKKDVLRRRGENVSALALENVIRQHPAIADVALSAVPAALGDDDIKASVVLADGAALEPAEFFAYLRDKVAYFAVPRYVDIRPALPVNALSRVMKHVLIEEGITDAMWDLERLGLTLTRGQAR
jgi:crotonobetaine/carnitine-CoA ligase